jgi:hypothetical protein
VYRFPFAVLGTEAVLGIGTGLSRSWDTDRWQRNPANTTGTPTPPLSFIENSGLDVGIGALIVGLVAQIAEWPHSDVSESLMGGGALVVAEVITTAIGQRGNAGYITPSTPATRLAGHAGHRERAAGLTAPAARSAFLQVIQPGLL